MTTIPTKTRNKVLLLLPYFGKWPEYLNLYFKGCERNKWLDILFITDCEIPTCFPENIRFIKGDLSKISSLIVEKLGLSDYKIPFSYKLCDFKPTYGCVFEDYIKEYEYWGYGDIDLIYGNLQPFVQQEIDLKFDVISARAEIVSGSFTLIKNNEYNNQLFTKLENFSKLIVSPIYEGIDETSQNSTIWEGLDKLELPKSCFTYLVAKENSDRNIKASFKTFICERLESFEVVKYDSGEIYFRNQKLGYFHYVMNKGKAYFSYPTWDVIPEIFYITDTGFYKALLIARITGLTSKAKHYLLKMPGYLSRKTKAYFTT